MSENQVENRSFEQNMARLEQIVALLERGDAQLADSLALFEEGTSWCPAAPPCWTARSSRS